MTADVAVASGGNSSFSYASRPRSLYYDSYRNLNDSAKPLNGNIMYDQRVIRGNAWALRRMAAEALNKESPVERQQLHERRQHVRQRLASKLSVRRRVNGSDHSPTASSMTVATTSTRKRKELLPNVPSPSVLPGSPTTTRRSSLYDNSEGKALNWSATDSGIENTNGSIRSLGNDDTVDSSPLQTTTIMAVAAAVADDVVVAERRDEKSSETAEETIPDTVGYLASSSPIDIAGDVATASATDNNDDNNKGISDESKGDNDDGDANNNNNDRTKLSDATTAEPTKDDKPPVDVADGSCVSAYQPDVGADNDDDKQTRVADRPASGSRRTLDIDRPSEETRDNERLVVVSDVRGEGNESVVLSSETSSQERQLIEEQQQQQRQQEQQQQQQEQQQRLGNNKRLIALESHIMVTTLLATSLDKASKRLEVNWSSAIVGHLLEAVLRYTEPTDVVDESRLAVKRLVQTALTYVGQLEPNVAGPEPVLDNVQNDMDTEQIETSARRVADSSVRDALAELANEDRAIQTIWDDANAEQVRNADITDAFQQKPELLQELLRYQIELAELKAEVQVLSREKEMLLTKGPFSEECKRIVYRTTAQEYLDHLTNRSMEHLIDEPITDQGFTSGYGGVCENSDAIIFEAQNESKIFPALPLTEEELQLQLRSKAMAEVAREFEPWIFGRAYADVACHMTNTWLRDATIGRSSYCRRSSQRPLRRLLSEIDRMQQNLN